MTFEEWASLAMDEQYKMDGKPVPVISTLLYKVCGGDDVRFDEGMRLLEMAFNAAKEAKWAG